MRSGTWNRFHAGHDTHLFGAWPRVRRLAERCLCGWGRPHATGVGTAARFDLISSIRIVETAKNMEPVPYSEIAHEL